MQFRLRSVPTFHQNQVEVVFRQALKRIERRVNFDLLTVGGSGVGTYSGARSTSSTSVSDKWKVRLIVPVLCVNIGPNEGISDSLLAGCLRLLGHRFGRLAKYGLRKIGRRVPSTSATSRPCRDLGTQVFQPDHRLIRVIRHVEQIGLGQFLYKRVRFAVWW